MRGRVVPEMPAGLPWGQYLRYQATFFISMLLGAQCVHLYYMPLDDLPHLKEEAKRQKKLEEGGSGR